MCEAGRLRESMARPESKNSNSLIGLEWHQTMAKYIIKRVAMGIFSIFIVATVTFFVMNLVPGGPFVAEKSISAAAQQALAEKYGLDKPLGVQYVNYMESLLHGDLGLSLRQRGRTVNQIIASKLPVSAVWQALQWLWLCAWASRWAAFPLTTAASGWITLLSCLLPVASRSPALFPACCYCTSLV